MMMAPGFALRRLKVRLTDGLVSDVQDLVEQLDLDPEFILAPLQAIRDHLSLAVSSFAGLRLSVGPAHHPIVFSDFASEAAAVAVRSSMTVPLASLASVPTDGEITFYAGHPGAFVDLAADLRFALNLSDETLALDRRPTPTGPFNAVTGLVERSAINRAEGILIDRGQTAAAALEDLYRRAAVIGSSLTEAAESVLAELADPGLDPDVDPVGLAGPRG